MSEENTVTKCKLNFESNKRSCFTLASARAISSSSACMYVYAEKRKTEEKGVLFHSSSQLQKCKNRRKKKKHCFTLLHLTPFLLLLLLRYLHLYSMCTCNTFHLAFCFFAHYARFSRRSIVIAVTLDILASLLAFTDPSEFNVHLTPVLFVIPKLYLVSYFISCFSFCFSLLLTSLSFFVFSSFSFSLSLSFISLSLFLYSFFLPLSLFPLSTFSSLQATTKRKQQEK